MPDLRAGYPRVTEQYAMFTKNIWLAWLSRTPIAVTSGRINQNCWSHTLVQNLEVYIGIVQEIHWEFLARINSLIPFDNETLPTRINRTAKSNVRQEITPVSTYDKAVIVTHNSCCAGITIMNVLVYIPSDFARQVTKRTLRRNSPPYSRL